MREPLALPPVEAVDALEFAALPGFVTQLGALLAAAGARMAAGRPPAPMPTEQSSLTQEEAAERYRIPLRKLRFLTRTGRVPAYQLGRNRMIRPVDLDRYLARCREQGAAVGTLLDVETLPDVVSRP